MTSARWRLVICVALGLVAGAVAFDHARIANPQRDFTQLWFAARALWRGENPYLEIGPHLAYDWSAPLLYPLPAVVAVLPLAWLPATWANGVFMGLGATAFAWALSRRGYGALIGFASASMLVAVEVVQWSPLVAAATVLPALGVVFAAKPTIGAAMWSARPSWWAIGGGVLLSLGAFWFDPLWVPHWLEAVRHVPAATPYRMPIALPGGPLILACLARWRRPEARMVAVLACVPQTLMPYETVPLFLVAEGWHDALLLTALSWGALTWLVLHVSPTDYPRFLAASGPVMVWALYLPATLLILRRPNTPPQTRPRRRERAVRIGQPAPTP